MTSGKGDTSRRSHTKKSKQSGKGSASSPPQGECKSSPREKTPSSGASEAPPPAKPAAMKTKFCLNCQKDLMRTIRITCAECKPQPPFELCVECFAVGTELGEHKKTHSYTVSDCLAFPIVLEPQSAAESADDTSSSAAAAAVGTNAVPSSDATSAEWTADEELLLLEGIEMFGMGNWKDIAEHVVTKTDKKCEKHYMTAYLGWKDLMPRFIGDEERQEDRYVDDTATAAQADTPTEGKVEMIGEMAESAILRAPPPAERSAPSQLAGYMPLRGDFDVEYDNEAEAIIADMEFSETDHPSEHELKLKVIEIYNQKLTEREQRKQFVVERGLLDYKLHQHTERKRPKEERELLAQMRPFARLQSPADHDQFVEGMITAMKLKKQILLLQEYRKNGVRTLAEAELYDAEKKKREVDQAIQKQRESASYLYESGRGASSGRDRANRWQNREQGAAGGDVSTDNSRTRGASASATGGLNAITASFSVDGTPGCHLLTPKEKELCSKLKLLPKHYLVIKDALIRECYRLGYLTKKMAKDKVQIDVNKTGHLYDFFVKCGWVKSESASTTVSPSLKTKSPTKKTKSPQKPPRNVKSAAVTTGESGAPAIPKLEEALSSPVATAVTPTKRKADEMEAGSSDVKQS